MRPFFPIVLISFLLVSCKQKQMTLEELQKAKWTNLTQGVDYISTRETTGAASEKDSFMFIFLGTEEKKPIIENYQNEVDSAVTGILSNVLRDHSLKSRAGYLKINLIEMMKPSLLEGQVYLEGDYAVPFSFSKDSVILLSVPGIRSARFISKEVA